MRETQGAETRATKSYEDGRWKIEVDDDDARFI